MNLGNLLKKITTNLSNKVNKSGDTMSGKLVISRAGTSAVFEAQKSDNATNKKVWLIANNDSDETLGVYNASLNKWIVRMDKNGRASVPIKDYASTQGALASKSVAPSSYVQLGSVTFPAAGIYIVDWVVNWEANANGEREIVYSTSASLTSDGNYNNYTTKNADKTWATVQHLTTIINVTSATQKHYLHAYQNSGSTISASFSCKYVRLGSA